MAEDGHSLTEWLDQYVAVIVSGEQAVRVVARLAGISDWGTSLAVPLDDESEGTETTVFYPWHRVESVRLAREDERPS
ncbi:MAG: hypothetical protein M3P92_02460 [Actinomycetota bacterium]|nr:hypothetical protein [Actinomycetota bacterium]